VLCAALVATMWSCGDAGEEAPIGVGLPRPCSAPLVEVDGRCWEKIPTSGSCDTAQPVAVRELGVCLPPCTTDSVCAKVAPGARCIEFEGAGKACVVPLCDNNVQDRGETGLDCGGVCKPCGSCGDGVVQEALGETCDHDGDPQTQCAYGQPSCEVCTAQCILALGQLTGFCGDGAPNGQEQCDAGANPNLDCAYNQENCTVCNAQCQRVPGRVTGFCGDGEVQAAQGETCDHNGSPQTQCPQGDPSCMVCNAQCKLVLGSITGFCGDGITNGQEQCDAGMNPSLDCPYGMMTGCMVCNDQCRRVAGNVAFCGDGWRNGPEQCDEPPKPGCNIGVQTCMVCTEQCKTQPSLYVLIPPGTFSMGSTSTEAGANERPVHQVTLTRGFYMSRSEVTQQEWQDVMGTNPSDCTRGCGPNNPVQNITWYDSLLYLNALSERKGLEKCYQFVSGQWTWPKGTSCQGYRLPTEAEWEYAARGGTTGDRYGSVGAIAWYEANSSDRTQITRTKTANNYHMHDMMGNVWEMVWDIDEIAYSSNPKTDPVQGGFTQQDVNAGRRIRGGSWSNPAGICRAPMRGWTPPNGKSANLGFRAVRTN
jgi:sulfatase modifying factor 1